MYKIILVGGEIVELDENQYLKFNESYESARTSTDLVQISDMRRIPKKKIDDIVITADVETSEAEKAIRVWYGTTANYNGIRHPFTYWREYLNDTREIEATNKILEMGAYGWGSKILDNYDNYPQELQAKMERPTMLLENLEELCRHFRKEITKIPDEELLILTKIESMRENLINKFNK